MKRILFALALVAVPASALAQPAQPCPTSGEGAVACLLADLNAVLPPGCAPVDFKALGKRVKDTRHISLFTKLRLATRVQSLMEEAREYDRSPTPAQLARLRAEYDDLFGDVVKRLEDKDAALVAEMKCARAGGFEVLLRNAKRENDKDG